MFFADVNTLYSFFFFFFFKQKTAYEITVRDWSSDVCSSDLSGRLIPSPPSPVQGRNNDSPARKCRVSKGSRLRAPRAPLCECLCRGGRLVRPGRAQARQDPNGCSRGRHDSGRTRLRRTRLGRARLSVVPPSPFNL